MLPLGTRLPDFTLTNAVDGKPVSSASLNGAKGVLVMFICNHCPFVIHIRSKLLEVAHHAVEQGFSVVAINSNSQKTHPQDGPANMKSLAEKEQWRFPFLFDESQAVAKAFRAACTPDLFLFDGRQQLAYRGQFDDARPSLPTAVTGRDLSAAIAALAAGKAPAEAQTPSIGCNIKWHPG
jgi:peroxiredoxin